MDGSRVQIPSSKVFDGSSRVSAQALSAARVIKRTRTVSEQDPGLGRAASTDGSGIGQLIGEPAQLRARGLDPTLTRSYPDVGSRRAALNLVDHAPERVSQRAAAGQLGEPSRAVRDRRATGWGAAGSELAVEPAGLPACRDAVAEPKLLYGLFILMSHDHLRDYGGQPNLSSRIAGHAGVYWENRDPSPLVSGPRAQAGARAPAARTGVRQHS